MGQTLPNGASCVGELAEREFTGIVIECFFRVYDGLGFGFLEAVYRRALAFELRARGLTVLVETPIDVSYRGVCVGSYRLDLLVEQRVAVEVKATELLPPTSKRQLLNYLRATTLDVGLLLHFGPDAKFHRLVSPRLIAKERSRLRPASSVRSG
jgi:GxxExxY protein